MKKIIIFMIIAFATIFSGCSNNYSNGERIGLIT
jgi:predicted small secreted protein